jgi:hypothetical protein
MFGGMGSEARFAHHVGFMEKAKVPANAPLLCALVRNRHRHKGLAVDMDEGQFQAYYSGRAAAKAQKKFEAQNAEIKGKKKTVNEFLEWTGKGKDHASFIPAGGVKP